MEYVIISYIIYIIIVLVVEYVTYNIFCKSDFASGLLFNIVVQILYSMAIGKVSIIGSALDALIPTFIAYCIFKKSKSFWDFILKQIIFGIAVFGVLCIFWFIFFSLLLH